MARAPRAGKVKTRLCPPLTPAQAAGFYACLIDDVLKGLAGSHGWDSWIAYTDESGEYFRLYEERGFSLLRQRGDSLGARMHGIFVDLLSAGYRSVVVVGSDVPGVNAGSAGHAFSLLEAGEDRVVLGPSDDGGYYLIGLRTPLVGLFEGIAWSTPEVLAQTLERAAALDAGVATIASCYDVDVIEDLVRLWTDLRRSDSLRSSLPKTHGWLQARYAPG